MFDGERCEVYIYIIRSTWRHATYRSYGTSRIMGGIWAVNPCPPRARGPLPPEYSPPPGVQHTLLNKRPREQVRTGVRSIINTVRYVLQYGMMCAFSVLSFRSSVRHLSHQNKQQNEQFISSPSKRSTQIMTWSTWRTLPSTPEDLLRVDSNPYCLETQSEIFCKSNTHALSLQAT